MSSMYLTLAQAGMLAPESDRDWIRESLGLPDVEEGVVSPEWQLETGLVPDGSATPGTEHGEI